MNELDRFYRNAKRLGLCNQFSQRWSDCKTKKQFFDLACDINSLSYLADTICSGYGLSPDFIVSEFGQFINGGYYKKGDYTSCIYCKPTDATIAANTTAMLIIDHKGEVYIPKNRICEVYLCKSNVSIRGEGRGICYCYDSNVVNRDTAPIVIREERNYGV